jgi:hypothetical protein
VGPAPDIIRELSNENALKIFTYNKPVLILFRNTTVADTRWYEKQLAEAFDEISNRILVCLAEINSSIGSKIAALVGLDV